MTWAVTDVSNLVLVAKDVGVKLSESICRKLDLGQSIDKDVEYLYLLCNIVFALEKAESIFTHADAVYEDADYSYLAEIINRIEVQRNRFRGI
jgi:hypothetical protein